MITSQKILARIAKICKDEAAAFGKDYNPRFPRNTGFGPIMQGAKAEGRGVRRMATDILTEIRIIRREIRKMKKETT